MSQEPSQSFPFSPPQVHINSFRVNQQNGTRGNIRTPPFSPSNLTPPPNRISPPPPPSSQGNSSPAMSRSNSSSPPSSNPVNLNQFICRFIKYGTFVHFKKEYTRDHSRFLFRGCIIPGVSCPVVLNAIQCNDYREYTEFDGKVKEIIYYNGYAYLTVGE